MQNQQGVFPAPTDYWLVAAPVRARKTRFKPKSQVCTTKRGVQRTARPTNSLRFYCEGLEEKFLERGAPAPLSVRLIDTTCASAKVWYSPSAHSSRP